MRDEQEILDHLEHHGVKGMRWGVRRSRGGYVRKGKGKSQSPDAQKAEAVKNKVKKKGGIQALSNRELSDFNRRVELEKNYNRLSQKDPIAKKGHDKVKALLAAGVTINSAIAFMNSPAGKKVEEMFKKKAA